MEDEFEVLTPDELPESPKTRGPYKKREAVIHDFDIADFEPLESEQMSEFEFLPIDFDWTKTNHTYVNSRDERVKTVNRPIIFIDGEGSNNGPIVVGTRKGKRQLRRFVQKQNYSLLGAVLQPDEYRCIVGQDNWHQLPTKQCLEFILKLPSDHIIMGFSLTYDVEMWLRDIDGAVNAERLSPMQRLLKYQVVWWRNYKIHYIPGKIFTVGKYRHKKRIASRTVYDMFGFFQSDFKTAIREWKVGAPKEWEFIDEMKGERPDFGPITERTLAYNKMEGIHGVQMFAKVRDEYTKLGLTISRPVGAGSIASAIMRKHKVQDFFPEVDPLPRDTMLSAYYGGRFDCTQLGFVGNVFDSDINSAYPHIARNLPCLKCGRYAVAKEYKSSPYAVWLVRWRDNGTRWAPFPYRTENGHIRYYANGVGWYHDSEVAAALKLDPNIEVLGGYVFTPNCEHRPFGFIDEYYEERQRLVAVGDFGEKIIKLGLNSIYGKLAQSKGKNPPFQQMLWAGMITAGTRAMLLDAIAQAPDDVLKVATDAVFSRVPLELNYHETELGAWKTEELYDFLILGNGIYHATGSSSPKHVHGISRNRGYDKHDDERFDWNQIRTDYLNGNVSLVSKREFRRYVKAYHEKKLEERCDWVVTEIELKMDIQKAKWREGEILYPLPNPTPTVISAPHKVSQHSTKENHSITEPELENE